MPAPTPPRMLPPAALPLLELLIAADDPQSLYQAFELGLGPLFAPTHSLIASFDFEQDGGPMSIWSSPKRLDHPPEWWRRNAEVHPGLKFARDNPGVAVTLCSDMMSEAEVERHPYFIEFMDPAGYRYAMGILVWQDQRPVGVVAINRARGQGPFTEAERAVALVIQPLLLRAYRRIARRRVEDDARRAQEALLATLPIPAVIHAVQQQRVLFANRAAREALARWRGEGARKRPRMVTNAWLPEEIREASAGLSRAGATVECPRGGMRALLRKMDAKSHFASDVVLIVIEDDEARTARSSAAWLGAARGLTTAERDAAMRAASGLSNAEIARALGKSALTVKKQLESVFAKVGVAGRTELAALVAGAPRARRRVPATIRR